MPIAPSPNNYTTGAMPKLYFQRSGGAEVHIGCISAASLEPTLEFVDHFCSQGGSRKKDKSVCTQKGLSINFNWDELNVENIRNFLYGDEPTSIGAGSDTVAGEEHIVPTTGLLKLEHNGVSSVTVAFRPDQIVHYDASVGQYTDFTSQCVGSGSTGVILSHGGAIGTDTVDVLYIGHSTKFAGFVTALTAAATLGSAVVKYEVWTGSGWSDITSSVSGDGKSFSEAGAVVVDTAASAYASWTKTALTLGNLGASVQRFWMRISYTTADPASGPNFNTIGETFVQNSDFAVVPAEGYIFRITTGSIQPGLKVDVDYTYTTATSKRFNVLETAVIEGQARLEFRPDVGTGFDYFMPKVSLKTNGAFEFSDTGWVTPPSTLEVLDASTEGYPDSPFGYIDVYDT